MRLWTILVLWVVGRLAVAQVPDTTRRAMGSVSGVVHDSIAHAPLSGATVQLVTADSLARFGRATMADSMGRFTLGDVPAGRYMLGFFHPMLDSLGLQPALREVVVQGRGAVRADLSIPSAARLRTAICGAASSSGVVVGVVRGARDANSLAGASVIGEWLEISFTATGMERRVPRLTATTGDNGYFALCNVPNGGHMALIASRGTDSTDRIELQVPREGFARRDLYLGAARTVVIGDTARVDTLAPPLRRVHLGDERVSGVVVAAVGGRPLAGAQVSIAGGPRTRANERGEWTLVDAPGGTRMLEVHAVGFYPERRHVDVVAGAVPLRIALSTLKAVLDTVRITASRVSGRNDNGFQERRIAGIGRFITAEDMARRGALNLTTDVFRNAPGLKVYGHGLERSIVMRGAFGDCTPSIYVDGFLLAFDADEIDSYAPPNRIAGIEIYADVVPPQFQPSGLTGCGSIVIWTK